MTVLSNFKDSFNEEYIEIIDKNYTPRMLTFTEDGDLTKYKYSIKLDTGFSQGIRFRMDKFLREGSAYIKQKFCKDCDDVLIDTSNKVIYLIEIKKEKAFTTCTAKEFQRKEKDTLFFIKYLFWLSQSLDEFDEYNKVCIRWKYKNIRQPDRNSKSRMRNYRNPYKKYQDSQYETYKVDGASTIFLDAMFNDYELIS
ncbi:hypothetical protein [Streptococcus equinus]|uniref:hypothetical protein n=1 Tax=Streptococcus equinus TaxID=1335 RepID=UPI003BF7F654